MTKEPDIKVVAIDETHHWREDIQEAAGKIYRLYLVDFSTKTHIAEWTPSMFAWHICGVSHERIEDDDLYMDIYHGTSYTDESDYFSRSFLESRVVDEITGMDFSMHDWQDDGGYKEMMEDLAQALRESGYDVELKLHNMLFPNRKEGKNG